MASNGLVSEFDLSIILPVYNNEFIIENSVNKIMQLLNDKKLRFEVILVDDGSVDNSFQKIKHIKGKYKGKVIALQLDRNYGQEVALRGSDEE